MNRTRIYPWEDWMDGRVWLLRGDVEFTCRPKSMQSQCIKAARPFNVRVATRVLTVNHGDSPVVMLQAYPGGSTWKPNLPEINVTRVRRALANPR